MNNIINQIQGIAEGAISHPETCRECIDQISTIINEHEVSMKKDEKIKQIDYIYNQIPQELKDKHGIQICDTMPDSIIMHYPVFINIDADDMLQLKRRSEDPLDIDLWNRSLSIKFNWGAKTQLHITSFSHE